MAKKKATWEAIFSSFKQKQGSNVKWDMEQLKTFYKNYRSAIKKTIATHKAHTKETGGGGPACLPADVSLAHSILGDDLKSLDNPHDSDSAYHTTEETVNPAVYSISGGDDCHKRFAGKLFSTPKAIVTDDEPVFLRKRQRTSAAGKKETADAFDLRQEQHDAIMANLALERKKLEAELRLAESKQRLTDIKLAAFSATTPVAAPSSATRPDAQSSFLFTGEAMEEAYTLTDLS